MYSYKQTLKASVEYFLHGQTDDTSRLTADLAAQVFADKYAMRDENDNLLELTPDDMHRRLASEFARIEAKKFSTPLSEEFIYGLLKDFTCIIPQGGPMSGIGNPHQYVSLSNCYVLEEPVDSYAGIMRTDEQLVQITKRRGGVGISLDNLRPTHTRTSNCSRTSTGVVSWATRYSNSTREVGQGGRRGALMLCLNAHHPDAERFATMKNDDKSVTGANISLKLTDEFLRAALDIKGDYEQRWPVNSSTPLVSRSVSAVKLWNTIIDSAHLRAEPGLLFWDTILRESPADCYKAFGFGTIATNPCAELPLSMLDSCRLLVLNLCYFVRDAFTGSARFDFRSFYERVQIAQRLMDDLIDLELECIDRIIKKIKKDPESEEIKSLELETWQKIRQFCENGRRTGLGITGLGDTMAMLGIKYGTQECIEFTDKVYLTLKLGAYRSSVDMAKELGPFKVWNAELEQDCDFLNRIKDEVVDLTPRLEDEDIINTIKPIFGKKIFEDMQRYGRRNIALLTTAPTGSTSILAAMQVNGKFYHNITAGVEPAIFLSYTRKKKGNHYDKEFRTDSVDQSGDHWMHFKVNHTGLQAFMDVTGKSEEESPYFNATSGDIDWLNRVKLQAAAQKHVDHAISSTINLPNDVSKETVAKIYETAWRAGCKGMTVYRDGCRTGVLVKDTKPEVVVKRPKEVACDIYHFMSDDKEYFIIVGLLKDKPYEIFIGNNISTEGDDDNIKRVVSKKFKNGIVHRAKGNVYELRSPDGTVICANIAKSCSSDMEALARLTSLPLRHGIELQYIVQQLEKTDGHMYNICKLLIRALKKYIPDGEIKGEACSQCQGKLVRSEGCVKCVSCGWSKC